MKIEMESTETHNEELETQKLNQQSTGWCMYAMKEKERSFHMRMRDLFFNTYAHTF